MQTLWFCGKRVVDTGHVVIGTHWLRLSWCVFRATVSKGWVNNCLWKADQSSRKGNTIQTNLFLPKRNWVRFGGCGRRAEVNTVFCSLFGSVLHSKQNWEAAWSMASDKRPLWKLIRAARPKEMKEHSYCRRDTPISLCVRAINHSTLHTTEEFNDCELWRGQGHDRIIKAKIKVSPLATTNHWNMNCFLTCFPNKPIVCELLVQTAFSVLVAYLNFRQM